MVNYIEETPGEPDVEHQHGTIFVANNTGLDVDGMYYWENQCISLACVDIEFCTTVEVESRMRIRALDADATAAQCREAGGFYNAVGLCINPFGYEAGAPAVPANCTAPACAADECTDEEAAVIDLVDRLSMQADCNAPGCADCLECTFEEFEIGDRVDEWRRNVFEKPGFVILARLSNIYDSFHPFSSRH